MRKQMIALSGIIILACCTNLTGQVARNQQSLNVSSANTGKLAKYDEVLPFQCGLARVKMNNKYGYINKSGNLVVPLVLNKAGYFRYYKGLAMADVETDEGFSVIDSNGKFLTSPVDFEIRNIDGYFFEAIKDNKYGLFSINGKMVFDIEYEYPFQYGDVIEFRKDGNTIYYNIVTKSIVNSRGVSFSEGLAAVSKNSRWGYIDTKGNEIIPFKYREAGSFYNGLAKVSILKKYGFINKQGREIIPIKYDKVEDEFTEGMCKVGLNGKYGFVDINGSERVPLIYDYVSDAFRNGLAEVSLNDKYGCVDKYGNIVIPIKYDQVNPPLVEEKGLYYLLNNNQKIRMYYDDFPDRNKSIILVGKNDKYGWINMQGKLIVPLEYDKIEVLDEAFIQVEKNNKIGIYTVNGNKVLEPIYDKCPYSGTIDEDDNQFMVRLNGKWKFVSFEGKILLQ